MVNRRTTLLATVIVTALTAIGVAQTPAPRALPLENLGLEHLDIIVPDPAASARFYSRIFKSPLHQQPVRDTLRYFIVLGDVPADRQVGYVAVGAAGGRAAAIGHYCALARVYDRAGVASALQGAGFGVAAAGPTGCPTRHSTATRSMPARVRICSPRWAWGRWTGSAPRWAGSSA